MLVIDRTCCIRPRIQVQGPFHYDTESFHVIEAYFHTQNFHFVINYYLIFILSVRGRVYSGKYFNFRYFI